MAIQKFEDIVAWQKAQALAVDVYTAFGKNKDLGFKDQIFRSVVSVSNNIAEGFDRDSDAEFSRFLHYSIASCSEVRSMVYLAERLKYISSEQKTDLLQKTFEVSKIIRGLIKSMSNTK